MGTFVKLMEGAASACEKRQPKDMRQATTKTRRLKTTGRGRLVRGSSELRFNDTEQTAFSAFPGIHAGSKSWILSRHSTAGYSTQCSLASAFIKRRLIAS